MLIRISNSFPADNSLATILTIQPNNSYLILTLAIIFAIHKL